MRITAHERYQNDPMFARIVDTLYLMLVTSDEQGNKQYTATELREAAMVACEKYEYTHIRPLFMEKQILGMNEKGTFVVGGWEKKA